MTVMDQQVADGLVPKTDISVPSSGSEALFDVEQAARHLNMSAKWVYRNYRSLPHILIDDGSKPRIKFRPVDLDWWIVAHRILPR